MNFIYWLVVQDMHIMHILKNNYCTHCFIFWCPSICFIIEWWRALLVHVSDFTSVYRVSVANLPSFSPCCKEQICACELNLTVVLNTTFWACKVHLEKYVKMWYSIRAPVQKLDICWTFHTVKRRHIRDKVELVLAAAAHLSYRHYRLFRS